MEIALLIAIGIAVAFYPFMHWLERREAKRKERERE